MVMVVSSVDGGGLAKGASDPGVDVCLPPAGGVAAVARRLWQAPLLHPAPDSSTTDAQPLSDLGGSDDSGGGRAHCAGLLLQLLDGYRLASCE